MTIKIYSIEISQNIIIDPLVAFETAKDIIEDQELGNAKPGIRSWEVNHSKQKYIYITTEKDYSKYKGKIIKEELQPGITVKYY